MKIVLLCHCFAIVQSVFCEAPTSKLEKRIGNSNAGSFVVPFQRLSRRDGLGAVLPLAVATTSPTVPPLTSIVPSVSSLPISVPKQVYGLATENSGDGLSVLARLQRIQNYGSSLGRKYNSYIKNRLGIALSTSLKKRSNSSMQMGDGPSD